LLGAVSRVEEVVAFFARGPPHEEIAAFRLSESARERLGELLRRNSVGELTPEEDRELDPLVLLDDTVSLIRAKSAGRPTPT